MKPFLEKAKIRLSDDAHYSGWARGARGAFHLLRSRLSRDAGAALFDSVQAYRFSGSPAVRGRALSHIRRHTGPEAAEIWREKQVGWSRYRELVRDPALTRTVVLKAPGPGGEKGVILSTFEYNWLRILAGLGPEGVRSLAERYDILFSTSAIPTSYSLLGLALHLVPGTVFVQACGHDEMPDIEALSPRLRCLPSLPCDWLDPAAYTPLPHRERPTDILMVANWAAVKRHWQLFDALRDMSPDLKVVLVGQPGDGRTLDDIRHQIRLYGAPQKIVVHQSLPIAEVARLQCSAKTSLIFSRREGCCVAVAESLMAGSPVGLIADSNMGPKAYINEQTGVLLDRRGDLASQLTNFVARSAEFDPRTWATAHISCHRSAEKLNSFLARHARESGRPWTREIVTPTWCPHPTVEGSDGAEDVRPAFDALHREFPKVFPADLLHTSAR